MNIYLQFFSFNISIPAVNKIVTKAILKSQFHLSDIEMFRIYFSLCPRDNLRDF
jgi:hypothetical protein